VRAAKQIFAIVVLTAMPTWAFDQTLNYNKLSQYYGFREIEIIKLDPGIQDLRIDDFNGDKRNDIAVVNNRKSGIELLIQKQAIGSEEAAVAVDPEDVDVNQISPPTRFKKETVAVSQKIHSFVTGDLNSDGMTDLAFYGEPKGLYIILQKAREEETDKPNALSWRTRKKIKIDDGLSTPNALFCADLNADGADDLALAGRDTVYIILQKEDGSLAEPTKFPTTSTPRGLEVGDLNGDGLNDLIVISSDAEKPIHARFGLRTGQLGPQEQFFIEIPFALRLYNTDGAIGDEILTVDARSGRLICYKLVAESQADAEWPILFYPLPSGEESTKRDLVVGDFDSDGLADVVISEPGAAELVFYRQTPALGLAEPVRFPAFADITSLSAADIDRDGRSELAVLSVKEKVIGLSKFENDRLTFPQPLKITGEPVAMALADVDLNYGTDCVYISRDANDVRSLRVIYDLHSAQRLDTNPPEKSPGDTLEEIGETEPALELTKLTSNPDGMKVLDVDQDGLADILIFVQYESPILLHQSEARKFEVIDSPQAQASLIKDASLNSIAVADVDDHRGKELLIAQKNFARSLLFKDGRTWTIIDQYNAKSTENRIAAVAAFRRDTDDSTGRPAIALLDGEKGQLQILEAGLDKTYRFEKQLDVGKWNTTATHLKILFASLTGGRTRSILLFDSEKFAIMTPPSKKDMPRHLEQQYSYETKIKDGVYGNLVVGDINSDARPDIVMVEYKRNHLEILALDPQEKPVPAMRFKIFEQKGYRNEKKRAKTSLEPRELEIADVTGDQKPDLVTVIHDRIIIYPQD